MAGKATREHFSRNLLRALPSQAEFFRPSPDDQQDHRDSSILGHS